MITLITLIPVTWLVATQWRIIRLFLHFQDNPWEVCWFGSTAVDNLTGYLIFVVLAAAIALAWRSTGRLVPAGNNGADPFLCLLWLTTSTFAAYYPRMDAAHLLAVAPLAYVVGVVVVSKAAEAFGGTVVGNGHRYGRRILASACILLLTVAVGLKLAPKVYSRIMLTRSHGRLRLAPTPVEDLHFDRADVYFPVYKSVHRLRVDSFREMILHVQNAIGSDEPFFAFPALAMAYFVSERDNPTRHDYFLGSNVRFDEQVEIIRILEQDRVEIVVVPSDQNDYFLKSCRPYTRLLWAYLKESYYLERRLDKYDVLRRYGTASSRE